MLVLLLNVPSDPLAVDQIGAEFETKLNVLEITGFNPSDALIVNVYVVFDAISGSVPDISPEAEFKVIPEGRVEPLAREYVIVESSVTVAETDIATCSANVPRDPADVTHTGLAFTYNASGIIPKRFEGFVTFMS